MTVLLGCAIGGLIGAVLGLMLLLGRMQDRHEKERAALLERFTGARIRPSEPEEVRPMDDAEEWQIEQKRLLRAGRDA